MLTAFTKCADEWGIEWNMVAYCAQQQISGRDKLAKIYSALPPEVAVIVKGTCAREWAGDFAMEAYCAEQNAESWTRLNNR
jgi:hypothetical protein